MCGHMTKLRHNEKDHVADFWELSFQDNWYVSFSLSVLCSAGWNVDTKARVKQPLPLATECVTVMYLLPKTEPLLSGWLS